MKLQINDSGSWRNVCSFDLEKKDNVMSVAAMLMVLMAPTRSVMKISSDGHAVAYCKAPDYVWKAVAPSA
jgi:hypothetical protein